jgi:regulator of chromosome condensation
MPGGHFSTTQIHWIQLRLNLHTYSTFQAELGRRVLARHKYESLVPRLVGLPKNKVAKIFAGFNHNFAIDTYGLVWSWGLNNLGQTGQSADNENLHVGVPTVVEGLRNKVVHHIAGGFHHSLACREDREVLGWGRCDESQLGFDIVEVPKDNVLFDSRQRARILLTPTPIAGEYLEAILSLLDAN